MLKFRGHLFLDEATGRCSCCAGDEQTVSVDPTGTGRLRAAFNSTLAIRWRGLRVLARKMIVDQDLLSMGGRGLMQPSNPVVQGGATRTQMFQRWFDYMAQAQVLQGDGSYVREFIQRGYDAGQAFAQSEVGVVTSPVAGDRVETILQLAVVELQGIIEAVSQGAVRAVANGILHAQRPAAIARAVNAAIDRVGVPRSTALVELIVVKAFSEASLDVYASAGVQRVGLVPETLIATPRDARRVTPTGRAGTRSRRGEGPGVRTIQRIKKQEREIAQAAGSLVRVKTAGDKKVCKVCRGIASRGPYRINTARSLIPAHPRCRCVFIPVRSTRDEFDPNQPRDPDGRWAETGSEGGASAPETLSEDEHQALSPDWDRVKGDKVKYPQMQRAILAWNGSEYEDINAELRGGGEWQTGPQQRSIRGLDRAFETLAKPAPRDMTVYRGVTTKHDSDFEPGAIIEDKGFQSTTHHHKIAASFAGDDDPRGVVLHIKIKKGHRVLVPELPDSFDGPGGAEPEILLNRGSRYRVTRREGRNVYATVE